MDFGRPSTAQRICAVAIAVTVVAAFLPWVTVFGLVSVLGISRDGSITLAIAVVGGALLFFDAGVVGKAREPRRGLAITQIVLGTCVALVGLVDMNGFAAISLYLTLFAGIGWLVGAIMPFQAPKIS